MKRRTDAPETLRSAANWLNYGVDLVVFFGLVVLVSRAEGFRLYEKLILVGIGCMLSTLVEYLLHRFLLHRVPILRRKHLEHHANPDSNIITTANESLLIAITLWLPLCFALDPMRACAVLAGVYLAYIAFKLVHDWVHFGEFHEGDLMYRLYRFHAEHHRDGSVNFGITTTVWDRFFGTRSR
jgi:sterol desaturase/sphingolipid hydroxylase (fatty acid hydroxylase superfamily)